MPIKKPKGRPKRKPGQYTTMPVKGLKPVKGPKSARKRIKPKTKRPKKGIPIKGRFSTMPVKQFV